jgi:hypothetical protein
VGEAADPAGNAGIQISLTAPADPVLVLNAGSSSLKFALVYPASAARPFSGLAERIGTSQARLVIDLDGHDRSELGMPGARHSVDYKVSATAARMSDDEVTTDRVLDALVGMSPAISWTDRGWMQVAVTATKADVFTFEAMSTRDYDERAEVVPA